MLNPIQWVVETTETMTRETKVPCKKNSRTFSQRGCFFWLPQGQTAAQFTGPSLASKFCVSMPIETDLMS